jgi:hypothetical protein
VLEAGECLWADVWLKEGRRVYASSVGKGKGMVAKDRQDAVTAISGERRLVTFAMEGFWCEIFSLIFSILCVKCTCHPHSNTCQSSSSQVAHIANQVSWQILPSKSSTTAIRFSTIFGAANMIFHEPFVSSIELLVLIVFVMFVWKHFGFRWSRYGEQTSKYHGIFSQEATAGTE